jgi:hypothetical protein
MALVTAGVPPPPLGPDAAPFFGLHSSTGQHHFDPVSRGSQLGDAASTKRPTRGAGAGPKWRSAPQHLRVDMSNPEQAADVVDIACQYHVAILRRQRYMSVLKGEPVTVPPCIGERFRPRSSARGRAAGG